ncbi:GumK N-terminal domain-containing glycosyltransferase [Cellvibrio japonicus]|uniref:UDP-GlcA beta-glucuronosyltransferase, putative, gt70A n=1 Tax=Cellvibrio japonicus (strain Ueda107) TaxID=498211 RepID=B3PJL2_CELJU|nr:glycosyltransferase [Cellvibrio japonicus]ACE84916.1 UDP-GlcA beta-glucuronosyltransferase, putative, gt70A [Cellvibrio japonicus Ueda107]QEI11296.1 glycosyltransferase [Cellvibrio japonicus]QEI14870.1 glycosyltransferase [Cellvibrio japonicus]QEI18450.1 glycosyltransferase [Cellvibrio japonicus]
MTAQPAISATPDRQSTPCFLVLSAHDFRSPRKANIHFISSELARRGLTRFFSLRYSLLSRYTGDPRLSLDGEANQIGFYHGVECYLWKTLIHPFNTRRRWLRPLENLLYRGYSQGHNRVLRRWIREADVILLESGIAPVFFPLIQRLNPRAELIYRASDTLEAIKVAEYVQGAFARAAPQLDTIALPSPAMADTIPSHHNLALVPQGIDHSLAERADPSPYGAGIHAVSVGSMLFDPQFFILAAQRFPNIQFHVIGSGQGRHPDYPANVHVYGEMPFAQTLPYIKHAQLGIAPYVSDQLPVYLRDTSMKLIQYEFFGVPAICPDFIAADYPQRFGYQLGDADSIARAIERALHPEQPIPRRQVLNWQQVTERLLQPRAFPDTHFGQEPSL